MPITHVERFPTNIFAMSDGKLEITERYFITTSGGEAEWEVYVAAPTYGALYPNPGNIPAAAGLYARDVQVEHLGNNKYSKTLVYRKPPDYRDPELGEVFWSFTTKPTGMKITAVQRAADQFNAPNPLPAGYEVGTSIGLKEDGSVEGVDVQFAVMEATAKVKLTRYNFGSHIGSLMSLAMKVNSTTFDMLDGDLTCQPGEVLYLGFDSEETSDGYIIVTMHFAYEPNRTIQVDTLLGGTWSISKIGQDYLWYRKGTDGQNTGVLSAHVAAVYERANLNGLPV